MFVDIKINNVITVKQVDDDAVLVKQRDEDGELSVVALTKNDLLAILSILEGK